MNCLCLNNNNTRSHNGYTKMEIEDKEEMSHRRAQFLIYKSMKKVDSLTQYRRSRSHSWLRLRVFRLKIRIGKRLKRLRKTISLSFSSSSSATAAKGSSGGSGSVYRHVLLHLKSLNKRLMLRGRGAMVSVVLPL